MALVNHFKVSDHFNLCEFACKGDKCCGGAVKLDPDLLAGIEKLRDLMKGAPLVINAGYRCEKHNKEIGGVKDSDHLRGCAADIRTVGTGFSELEVGKLCEQIPEFKRIGVYNGYQGKHGFVHVSSIVNPKGAARWGDWHE